MLKCHMATDMMVDVSKSSGPCQNLGSVMSHLYFGKQGNKDNYVVIQSAIEIKWDQMTDSRSIITYSIPINACLEVGHDLGHFNTSGPCQLCHISLFQEKRQQEQLCTDTKCNRDDTRWNDASNRDFTCSVSIKKVVLELGHDLGRFNTSGPCLENTKSRVSVLYFAEIRQPLSVPACCDNIFLFSWKWIHKYCKNNNKNHIFYKIVTTDLMIDFSKSVKNHVAFTNWTVQHQIRSPPELKRL